MASSFLYASITPLPFITVRSDMTTSDIQFWESLFKCVKYRLKSIWREVNCLSCPWKVFVSLTTDTASTKYQEKVFVQPDILGAPWPSLGPDRKHQLGGGTVVCRSMCLHGAKLQNPPGNRRELASITT